MNYEYSHKVFIRWTITGKERRVLFAVLGFVVLVQFVLFKLGYPFPNFLPDSYSYIEVAANNREINMWPVGYSRFLRLVSCISRSPLFLVSVQYMLLLCSTLYFTATLIYVFNLKRTVGYLLVTMMVLNPLLIHTANLVASDALFATLSLLWATTLIWIAIHPSPKMMLWQALLCCLAFTVRYNALYYPVIGAVLLLFVKFSWSRKIAGILVTVCLPLLFVMMTMSKYRESTGVNEFSPFGGWQMASNALYGYAHVPAGERQPVPVAYAGLHTLVNSHMDSVSRLRHRPDETPGIYYLWNPASPLKVYEQIYFVHDTVTTGFGKWARMSGLYKGYGQYLAKTYPAQFVKYYLLPNLLRYYVPDPEFLGIYNMKSIEMEQKGVDWFGLKSARVKTAFSSPEIPTMNVFPVCLAIINLLFVLAFLGFLFLAGWRKSTRQSKSVLLLMGVLWLCNLVFSVLASPIVLRYQLFALCFTLPLCIVFIEFLVNAGFSSAVEVEAADDMMHTRNTAQLTAE